MLRKWRIYKNMKTLIYSETSQLGQQWRMYFLLPDLKQNVEPDIFKVRG